MPPRLWARQLAGAALAVALAACGGSPTNGEGNGGDVSTASLLRGADVSALERIEQAGGVFKDGGQAGDAIAILHNRGANAFRLRVFVNPNGQEVQVNDLPYTVRMAVRIKAAGARLLLDLHYSDTWADPSKQTIPTAWAALSYDSLVKVVESYTDSVVTTLKQAGALPDVVQLGNEIEAGILWPQGQLVFSGPDTSASWDRFAGLLKAGIRGVRDALGPNDAVRILLHYSQAGNAGGTQWFFDHLLARGVDFDLVGLSYYPWWQGSLGQLITNLRATAARYGKGIVVVEASYPWRAGGWESMATDRTAMTWAVSPQGQAQFLHDLQQAVASTPGGLGAGVIWWYPEAIQVPGLFVWGGGSLAMFDDGGTVLAAASEFQAR